MSNVHIHRGEGRYPNLELIIVSPLQCQPTRSWFLEGALTGDARWTEEEILQVSQLVCSYPDPPNDSQFGASAYFFQKFLTAGPILRYGAGKISLSNSGVSRTLMSETLDGLLGQWKQVNQNIV